MGSSELGLTATGVDVASSMRKWKPHGCEQNLVTALSTSKILTQMASAWIKAERVERVLCDSRLDGREISPTSSKPAEVLPNSRSPWLEELCYCHDL